MIDEAQIRHELKVLRAERKSLVDEFGDRGQKHYMNVAIGGLNPAAQRLHTVRLRIATLEKMLKGPEAQVIPKSEAAAKGKGTGLLYDITFGIRRGMIGRTVGGGGRLYIVENGDVWLDENGIREFKTLAQAVKAFERGR